MPASNSPLYQNCIRIIALCLLVQLLICTDLWFLSERGYPFLPVFEKWPLVPLLNISFLLFPALLITLLSILIFPAKRILYYLFLLFLTGLLLPDLNRLQVWVYEFSILLLFLGLGSSAKSRLLAAQMILVLVYCWSGLHKFNNYFIHDIAPWMMTPFGLEQWMTGKSWPGLSIAVFETLLGLGLWINWSRRWAAGLAMLFHLSILFALGPLGHNWNEVVWPWNIAMILLVYSLFFKTKMISFTPTSAIFKKKLQFLPLLLLFGLMPLFNFWHLWDEQLSFKMYSGSNPEGIFYYEPESLKCLPEQIKVLHERPTSSQSKRRIILDEWIFEELRVAPYVSVKRLRQMGRKLCDCVENPANSGLEILITDRWNEKEDIFLSLSCEALQK